MLDDKQIANKDAVETDVGLVHVMPKAYQGGKLPEGSMVQEPKPPAKHEVVSKPPERKLPPAALVKKAPPKPLPPKKNRHKNRILLIVGGVVVLVLVAVVVILLLTNRPPEPEPPVAPVVTVPETPIVSVPPEPASPTVPDEPVPPEPFVKEPIPGRDTDSDGLSDVEERMYGSNVRLPDTDRDGFLDGNEVFHRYDPLTPDPATLLERGLVAEFDQGVHLLYPSIWESSFTKEPTNLSASFEAPSGERFLITARELPTLQSLETYLVALAAREDDPSWLDVEYSTSKVGLPLAMQKNQMRAILMVNGWAVVVEYDLGPKQTIDFVQTFQMLVNSIELLFAEE